MQRNSDQVTAMGRRMGYFRRLKDMSAAQLAEAAGQGLTRSVIANLENGRKADLTVQQLLAIAEALDVPATSILGAGDRVRAAMGEMDSSKSRYLDAMRTYLDALITVAIEADRADLLPESYIQRLESMFEGASPARLTMAEPMSEETRAYLARERVREGKYVTDLLSVLKTDLDQISAGYHRRNTDIENG